MRKTIYYCDNCAKEAPRDRHLSIIFGNQSGWVEPVNPGDHDSDWHHSKKVSGVHQFCNSRCLGAFFNKLKKR